ncbi:MAG: acetolactate synthase small subunit [Limnochordia bacterium]|jgi:acetolactate synthase-1/3 small subunit|nr:acetolactate synthase small subunit [Bacillota bacterium]
MKKHIIAVLVQNKSGVMARVAALFSRRGYNIDSIAVCATEDPEVSRMTIVARADDDVLEQITKQLNKLVEVIKVSDITNDPLVDRELALIKVGATPTNRADIIQIVDIFRAHIVDVNPKSVTVEVTGDEGKMEAIIQMLRPYGIKEIVRTGKIAMVRGGVENNN